MTREEADIIRDFWRLIVSERYTDEEIKKAYDKAIETEKKEGEEK